MYKSEGIKGRRLVFLGEGGSEMLLGFSWRSTLECGCIFPCIMARVYLQTPYLLYKEGRRRGRHFYRSNPLFSSCSWHSNKICGKIVSETPVCSNGGKANSLLNFGPSTLDYYSSHRLMSLSSHYTTDIFLGFYL